MNFLKDSILRKKCCIIFFITKQGIHIYVPYSWQNGWTKWVEFFKVNS